MNEAYFGQIILTIAIYQIDFLSFIYTRGEYKSVRGRTCPTAHAPPLSSAVAISSGIYKKLIKIRNQIKNSQIQYGQ